MSIFEYRLQVLVFWTYLLCPRNSIFE